MPIVVFALLTGLFVLSAAFRRLFGASLRQRAITPARWCYLSITQTSLLRRDTPMRTKLPRFSSTHVHLNGIDSKSLCNRHRLCFHASQRHVTYLGTTVHAMVEAAGRSFW